MPLGAGFQNVNFTDACRIRGSPAVREPSRTDWKRRAACWSGDLFGGIGGGKPARVTTLQTKTSYAQDPDQVVYFYTVVRGDLLWTAALAAPRSQAAQFEPLSRQIIGTVQFPD